MPPVVGPIHPLEQLLRRHGRRPVVLARLHLGYCARRCSTIGHLVNDGLSVEALAARRRRLKTLLVLHDDLIGVLRQAVGEYLLPPLLR